MTRIPLINPDAAGGRALELLDEVQTELGMTPNLYRTLANSPAALEAFLGVNRSLAQGKLSQRLRRQIALHVAELSGCEYCVAAHSALGKVLGLSAEAVRDSRRGRSPDAKTEAALLFTGTVVKAHGRVADPEFVKLRAVGFDDGEITEIVANISAAIFSSYLMLVADTVVDFPQAGPLNEPDHMPNPDPDRKAS